MILTPFELPSQGLFKRSPVLNITGLGFQDLLDYSREYQEAQTPMKKYLVDYEWIKRVFPNEWRDINLVDLDAIILKWKMESLSENNELTITKACPKCGEVNTLNIILEQLTTFIPVEFDLEGEIELGGDIYKFRCPSLDEFDSVVIRNSKSGRCRNIELLKLISLFPDYNHTRPNLMENLVLNAKKLDMKALKTLSSVYFKNEIRIKTRCSKCKSEDWSMGVSSLIDNPFLTLVLSTGSTRDKIIFKQIRRTE